MASDSPLSTVKQLLPTDTFQQAQNLYNDSIANLRSGNYQVAKGELDECIDWGNNQIRNQNPDQTPQLNETLLAQSYLVRSLTDRQLPNGASDEVLDFNAMVALQNADKVFTPVQFVNDAIEQGKYLDTIQDYPNAAAAYMVGGESLRHLQDYPDAATVYSAGLRSIYACLQPNEDPLSANTKTEIQLLYGYGESENRVGTASNNKTDIQLSETSLETAAHLLYKQSHLDQDAAASATDVKNARTILLGDLASDYQYDYQNGLSPLNPRDREATLVLQWEKPTAAAATN